MPGHKPLNLTVLPTNQTSVCLFANSTLCSVPRGVRSLSRHHYLSHSMMQNPTHLQAERHMPVQIVWGIPEVDQGAHTSRYRRFRRTSQVSSLQPSNHAGTSSNVHWQNWSEHQAEQSSKRVAGGGYHSCRMQKHSLATHSPNLPPPSWVLLIARNWPTSLPS